MKDLDKRAYNIVCNWYKSIDFNPVYKGIDYSLIIRFYLWDKVGRALRIQNGIGNNEVDAYKEEYKNFPQYYTTLLPRGSYKRNLFSRKKIIFIPYQSSLTQGIVSKLHESKSAKVISKISGDILPQKRIIKLSPVKQDKEWSEVLYSNLIKALNVSNINLIPEDVWLLKEQIYGAVRLTNLAVAELKTNKPDAVYVHSDNHPPYINYVLAAKMLNIPTFTYQHGLDCEHYYYNDCFADYVAVWSAHRKNRYILNSLTQPISYKIVGNVFLNNLAIDKNKVSNTILYITRPHKPLKCYAPSRSHKEGLEILKVILKFLLKNKSIELIIKPHPMDIISFYTNAISECKLQNRARIKNTSINELLSKSAIVITEDSTAGVEVMRFGIPLIHANFSTVEPVLPLVKEKAALKGFNEDELLHSIELAFNLDEYERATLIEQQKQLSEKLIPKGNVKSVISYILENI
ncbi:UDP-N-acetyl glucosamine 2-epimerase [Hyunsoonleella aestuarii]|uniref:UDP-N-acetyl glucosamine 2-epimerase n=1 Tax=Hyunsoonleella aestuarii TaxID=912802 RepID=UPI00111156C6|nr:UDP-N-acetyl glucosamine 2-epimerase [Hyunsoonleella aestuarii]